MAQFDLYRNPNARKPDDAQYFVMLQSDFVEFVNTRLVAPLYQEQWAEDATGRMFPKFVIDGDVFVMMTPEMAGIARTLIGGQIGSAADRRDDIMAAIDLLISGF